MPIPFPMMFKTVLGNNDFELQAGPGESFRVYSIRIARSAGDFLTLRIDNTTVGYFQVSTTAQGNHLHFPPIDSDKKNILERAISGGLFRPFPIATGQKLVIHDVKQAWAVQQVIYTKHPAGEVRATEPNGSQSLEYDFVSYGYHNGNLAEGDNEVDTCLNPSEFPQFPYEGVVPAKHTMKLHGIVASDACKGQTSTADSTHTDFLKLIHERTVLADPDSNGIYLGGGFVASDIAYGAGYSNIGYDSDVDQKPALMLPTPLIFPAGDDLDCYLGLLSIAGGQTITGSTLNMGLLFTCKREG